MSDTYGYYSTLATTAGVEWCPLYECDYLGAMQHKIVHMAPPSRITKRGVHYFLHMAWMCSQSDTYLNGPKWLFIYRKNVWIQWTAKKAKVRLPRSLFELDRARLREALSDYSSMVPAYARPPAYEAAKKWAER